MFRLYSEFNPAGDQPNAIRELVEGIRRGQKYQTLLGVTGSGKTFTISNVIQEIELPTLVISHNKTLAAQLYGELKGFFPENAVEYFISYYDYYQPEAYMPATDTYIEKDASINEDIERMRLRTTAALMERDDVIVVASVSCIYGLGSPEDVKKMMIVIEEGKGKPRDKLISELVASQYLRNDIDFQPGTFRVKGDIIDIYPGYENYAIHISYWGDEIEKISIIDPLTAHTLERKKRAVIYPAKHFVVPYSTIKSAVKSIEKELNERLEELEKQGKLLEAQRLKTRTRYDIEFLREAGYCPGIENYSRHLSGRAPGERPGCLLDFFPEEFLTIIDESHVTIPQVRGMYNGDHSRKQTLVDYGFRLPSALDNRPLKFDEFMSLLDKVIFISATPDDFEIELSKGVIVEQIIRPTGLVDPPIIVKPTKNYVDDLMDEIRKRVKKDEKSLITTLTKRMAEDLAEYLLSAGVKVKYIHSEIQALERIEILRGLRLGEFDVIVGVNLLREGLDLPEVSLVAILDADKEGFLRSEKALIQTAGRTARNINGIVILYADTITKSMKRAIDEMERRRKKQIEYNKKHNITPKSIIKTREEILKATAVADEREIKYGEKEKFNSEIERLDAIDKLTRKMKEYAENYEFEKAAEIRDRIRRIMNEQIKSRRDITPIKGSN